MTRGGAAPQRGFGMVSRGGARMSVVGAVPRGGRGVVMGRGVGGLNGSTRGVGGLNGSTRGVGGLNGRTSGIGGLNGRTKGVGGLNGRTRGVEGLNGSTRGVEGLNGSTRGIGGFTGSRVKTRGGGGYNGVGEKKGNSAENVMSGAMEQYEKITPEVSTNNRVIEVIDLDESFDIVEEKPTINDQKVDQEPLGFHVEVNTPLIHLRSMAFSLQF